MPVKLPLEKRNVRGEAPDLELIRELAALLDETGLTEIEVGEGERRVRIARAHAPQHTVVSGGAVASGVPQQQVSPVLEETPAVADSAHPGAVNSPMVGVVYLSPEPGAPQFASVGDTVSEGQTLFIVEAMKTMNPIRAPRGGKVVRILVENAVPVEYGEVLLILE